MLWQIPHLRRGFWLLAGWAAVALGSVFVDTAPGAPAVWGFLPAYGPPGTVVTILGRGLGEAGLVTFAGNRADFTLLGPLAIRATVPAGALAGPISVTTPQGTATSPGAYRVGPATGMPAAR